MVGLDNGLTLVWNWISSFTLNSSILGINWITPVIMTGLLLRILSADMNRWSRNGIKIYLMLVGIGMRFNSLPALGLAMIFVAGIIKENRLERLITSVKTKNKISGLTATQVKQMIEMSR